MSKLPPDSADEPTPLQRKLRSRRNQRRPDLRSIDGVLRESAGNYLDMRRGVVSLEAGDIYSRVISRHRELLVAHNQEQQVADLVRQLKELNAEGRGNDFDVDDLDAPIQLDAMRAKRITKQT